MKPWFRLSLVLLLSVVATIGVRAGDAPSQEIAYTVTLIADASVATSINDSGQVTGRSMQPDSTFHAYSWTAGALTDLGPSSSGGIAINNSGQIAGSAPMGLNGERVLHHGERGQRDGWRRSRGPGHPCVRIDTIVVDSNHTR
jgi:probable HAF family extracellular repeat protein